MISRGISIRTRLMILMMAGLLAISFIFFFEARTGAIRAANEAYDRALLGSALAISERVLLVGKEIEVDIPYVALEMLVTEHQDRIYYQVETQSSEFLTGYPDLPKPPSEILDPLRGPVFYDAPYKGEIIRVGVVEKFLSSPHLSTRVFVKVAETTDARDALIDQMVSEALFRQFVMIAVAAAILWIGIFLGLKPLEKLQDALNRRNPDDLHPIEHDVPEEVQGLIAAINNLMGRLEENIESMRRFTSNAAHQLRTPLAAIHTQTELALKAGDTLDLKTHLNYLQQATRQSTRLVNQLLSLAKVSPDHIRQDMSLCDVNEFCRSLTKEKVPQALKAEIDLGFEGHSDALKIQANASLLKEAVHNLIDNALLYSPAKTEVTLRVYEEKNQAIIEVEDNGPGLGPDQLQAVFDRFDRAGRSDGFGCGLGLPIVQEIAEFHHGQITLSNRVTQKGLSAKITIPLA